MASSPAHPHPTRPLGAFAGGIASVRVGIRSLYWYIMGGVSDPVSSPLLTVVIIQELITSHDKKAISPTLAVQPVRPYPLRPVSEPAVYVMGDKLGQKVYPPGHPLHGQPYHPPPPGTLYYIFYHSIPHSLLYHYYFVLKFCSSNVQLTTFLLT
jgi:hypothetical protein